MKLKKCVKIFCLFFKYSFMNAVEYKANFILGGLFEFLWVIMNVLFFGIIYSNTSTISGWTQNDAMLLVFVCGFIDAVHSCFSASGFISIPDLIRTGDLDFIFLKPINKRFYMTFRLTNVGELFNILFNLSMIIFYLVRIGIANEPIRVVFFFVAVGIGLLIVNSFYFILSMLAFWVINVNSIIGYSQELFTIGNKPITIYPKAVQKIFTFIIPLGIAFSYPVLFYAGKYTAIRLIIALIIAFLFFGVSHILYRRGLKRYSSASS
ncbi:ABC transporter permease [[Clostridium] polysaccharolyticum]|uniref:ABC-2 type transport system permease protein n=1 Tax=[Clostridium] polysaccharolyticum TaxID=29364 RepID=A0A1I0BD10_9FIRM|nr:ABC-2 family transporter protein [[Clostridium] polysaccharolyticum]SET04829.1 ABC-2 type transport system permease protein [[Clostridium] polysaccharolyticum]